MGLGDKFRPNAGSKAIAANQQIGTLGASIGEMDPNPAAVLFDTLESMPKMIMRRSIAFSRTCRNRSQEVTI